MSYVKIMDGKSGRVGRRITIFQIPQARTADLSAFR